MTPAPTTTIDLARLALSHGEGRRLELPLRPGTLELGGQTYASADPEVPARLDVSRTNSGYAFRLRFPVRLQGPCMRCLADAHTELEIDAREVDQERTGDEELRSPYVEETELDLGRWAHDAMALALPAQILCRPECAGLCPICGESLNDAAPGAHDHESAPDPRWAKLRELE
jgi:uncharacterized protein